MKLGPHHLLNGGADTVRWLRLAPTVAKAVDDLGVLAEALPGTLRIGRVHADWHGSTFDANVVYYQTYPNLAAEQYVAGLADTIRLNPWLDLVEGPNEQIIRDPLIMEWYADFLYHFARLLVPYGKRAGIGGWATGWPLRQDNLWPRYTRALDACREFGAIHTRHSYSDLDEYNALRHRYDARVFASLGYPRVPTIISECGTDAAGTMAPWRIHFGGDAGRYWHEWCVPFCRAIEQDPDVLGATLFSVGDGGGQWREFDVLGSGLVDLAAGYVPAPEQESDDVDAATVAEIRQHLIEIDAHTQAIDELLERASLPPALYRVRILATALNVRTGPSAEYAISRQVKAGDELAVYEQHPETRWQRISADEWISGSALYSVRL